MRLETYSADIRRAFGKRYGYLVARTGLPHNAGDRWALDVRRLLRSGMDLEFSGLVLTTGFATLAQCQAYVSAREAGIAHREAFAKALRK